MNDDQTLYDLTNGEWYFILDPGIVNVYSETGQRVAYHRETGLVMVVAKKLFQIEPEVVADLLMQRSEAAKAIRGFSVSSNLVIEDELDVNREDG